MQVEIDVLPAGENLEVAIHHNVVVSKAHGLDNFRGYLQELYNAFEQKYTRTMHQLVMADINGLPITAEPSVFQKVEDPSSL